VTRECALGFDVCNRDLDWPLISGSQYLSLCIIFESFGQMAERPLEPASCEGHDDGKEGDIVWRRKQPAISDELLDQLLAGADPKTAFVKDDLKKVRSWGRPALPFHVR
jgi:hypothetical protein